MPEIMVFTTVLHPTTGVIGAAWDPLGSSHMSPTILSCLMSPKVISESSLSESDRNTAKIGCFRLPAAWSGARN